MKQFRTGKKKGESKIPFVTTYLALGFYTCEFAAHSELGFLRREKVSVSRLRWWC